MKGTIRIGVAVVLGVVIILVAFYVKQNVGATAPGTVVVGKAPERPYIEAGDTDGNGVKDWEESLQARVFDTIKTPTSTLSASSSEEYVPPTTFTGKFSEAFFKDYLEGKMHGQDFSDPSAIVGNAVKAIDQNTQSKRHSRLELHIVPSTPESVRVYGNQIADIMRKHSIHNENEAVILQHALTRNDPRLLEALDPIHAVYEKIIADTLQMEVPDSLADRHLVLLNVYESILTDIEAMRVAFIDPLYSLARVRGYVDDAKSLFIALQNIARALAQSGVTYTKEEPGAFFYLFDT